MNRKLGLISIAVVALNMGIVGGVTSSLADEAGIEARVGELRGEILPLLAPAGAVATETNLNYKGAVGPAPTAPASPAAADWPSYNKTLTSERFSDLSQIHRVSDHPAANGEGHGEGSLLAHALFAIVAW